ncbi:hypothetical protein PV327_004219 [Microctonus hyperodae]|uniref:2-oxo-4-hydroxy-4-carboxy-5-ureidoimidazoline decarboxylase n=1 Tax=Microctonus hyperodae TaxID=165561 RepID=A0AA39FC11_MICHY|nr:hypothetical protein PV327_004219 [Microctonus hyperodae]
MTSRQLLTIEEVNALKFEDFESLFRNIIECCPEAAQKIRLKRPFNNTIEFEKSFHNYIDNLDENGKEILLKKHPQLAGKVYEDEISEESQNEQKSAGINSMDEEYKHNLKNLNKEYENKFAFPFVICVRENTVITIIKEIQRRLMNNRTNELNNSIEEVKKICSLRLNDIVL